MRPFALLVTAIFIVSCSKSPDVIELLCKEDGEDKERVLIVDFINSTISSKDSNEIRNVDVMENEIIYRNVQQNGEAKDINEIILDRRTLILTVSNYVEIQNQETLNIVDKKFQCKVLEVPDRQI